jgi:hypothetical protein
VTAARPIERVARDLREVRRTLAVVRATEALDPADPELVAELGRRLDGLLLEAARALEVAVPLEWLAADGGLSDDGRLAVLGAVRAAGLAVDP